VDHQAPFVAIVAYRSDHHLSDCLAELGSGLAVLVVDNDASESTRSLCANAGVDYVANPSNLGFAGAVNIAIGRAPGRDVLLLNPDARIGAAEVLELQMALRDPAHHRGAVGPYLVDRRGAPDHADWPLPSPAQVWRDALGLGHRTRGPRFVTGAVLLLRAETIAEIGGFDERYFLYAEEADWQRRALDAGWEVAVVPHVEAMHVGAGSSADNEVREAHAERSSRAFARRWYGVLGAASMRAGSAVAAARRASLGADRATGRRALHRQLRRSFPPAPERPTIVHVVRSDSFAGVERSIVEVASEQHRRGWRVVVVGGDPAVMRQELPPGVLTLPGATLLRAYRSLRRLGRVDVVHAHMTAAEAVAALAKHSTGGRLVATRHFAAPRGSSALARPFRRGLARRIDHEFAISGYVAEVIEAPSTVVPHGVRSSDMSRPREHTVVVLQRFEPEKQTDVAVRAWALSGLGEHGWRLVVHGKGSQRETLHRLAAELGCATSVSFPGFADHPREALTRASVLLATTPIEGFGLTVAEAMAEGTPVVAADGGAHREVLGPDGRFFAPGDAPGAAAELRRLVALSDAERSELGARLRERQRALFTVESEVDALLEHYQGPPRIALLSPEPWDDVWRRNQHVASRLVRSGRLASLLFVNPPDPGLALRSVRHRPEPGIEVVTPPLLFPRRFGGHRLLAAWLRRATADADLWWVNDPVAGDGAREPGRPAVYDVTDDWRELDQPEADRRRIIRAEDRLARAARTVVCSPTLADRWRQRYAVEATLVGNGVDVAAIRSAEKIPLPGSGPHLVYVGTAHPNRIDVALLLGLVDEGPGTLHLVGPDSLDEHTRRRLDAGGTRRHGPVPSSEVPTWLASADVLVCPHLVNEFTLSLDAIKSYEYLATTVPVVATRSSGFESAAAPGLTVVDADGFVAAVRKAVGTGPHNRESPPDWDQRATEFAAVLETALHRRLQPRVRAPR
jgi:glycosyltransferase involved in cell wall biosynthesis/GT2 family glycosyltransferase